MALVKYKECNEEVSTKAKECPKCGAPIKKEDIYFDVGYWRTLYSFYV